MHQKTLAFSPLLLALSWSIQAAESRVSSGQSAYGIEEVFITGVRANRSSKGATGLEMDIKETPQSISQVSAELIENFSANSLNDALRLATGISVEEWETNRTNYVARGFEIKNTQVDGVGLPNNWGIATGATDSFAYEKLEVIRGANGLLTGVGNASGTINYVRKRPTNTAQGKVGVSGGSYDFFRVEGDYSAPFTDSGDWAGRIVAATEDKESYLRGLSNDRGFIYGVVDGQLGERGTLTVGYTYANTHTNGNMWGAVTFAQSDGTQAEFDQSVSTTQDWTYWDTSNQSAFVEYTYALGSDWNLKASYNYRQFEDADQLFFAYSMTGLDPQTGEGLVGWPGSFFTDEDANLYDLSLDGSFSLFGREHQAMLGASYGDSSNTLLNRTVDSGEPAFGALPAFPYALNAIPEPAWGAKTFNSSNNQTLTRIYGASKLSLSDSLSAIVGFNSARYHRDGYSGGDFDQTESETSPYAGLTLAVSDNTQLYASYSDIYQPQDQQDINGHYLAPSKGVNYELGVKADWLNQKLLTTFAWFSAEQEGLGTYGGWNPNTGTYFYIGKDVKSEGIEAEVSGHLTDSVDLVLGYTHLQLDNQEGESTYQWVPRNTLNLSLSAQMPFAPQLTLGTSARWQSETSNADGYSGVVIHQDAYAVINAFARWEFSDQANVQLNINNLTDEKYIGSLYNIGYYAAPLNASVSFNYSF